MTDPRRFTNPDDHRAEGPNDGGQPPRPPEKKRGGCLKKLLLAILAFLVAIVLLVILVSVFGGGDAEETASPDETTQPSAAPSTQGTPAPPAATEPDPRCRPADGPLIALLKAGIEDDALTLTNGQMITDGDNTWVGATTMRPDGQMENRSDAWLFRDGIPFNVTGGARSTTPAFADASGIGASAGDEAAQAVDRCVIALTTGG